MSGERVLVVDDVPTAVDLLRRHLEGAGYRVSTATSVSSAVEVLERAPFDLVVTDQRMPGGDGMDLVAHVREHLEDTEVMLVTGFGTITGAVQALQHGACDYVVKPYTEDELLGAVERTLSKLRRRRATEEEVSDASPVEGIVGDSPPMADLAVQIDRAAATNATVLISGESGTGKELVARAIHARSGRSRGPFVAVNCGAIAETLMESELFGHEKGAFTGADRARIGYFQAAEGGTVFLDEISETSPATQLRLLRVLQEREISRIGSTAPRRVDVRVIAASNRDLGALVRQGTFREDLYYRIHVVDILVPPLRDRGEDVLLLVKHFATRFAEELGLSPLRFSDAAILRLLEYDWPGNVREVQSLVQRLTVMTRGDTVAVTDLPPGMRTARRPRKGGLSLKDAESEHIQAVLSSTGGNKAEAARVLDIDRKTLYNKIKQYDLDV